MGYNCEGVHIWIDLHCGIKPTDCYMAGYRRFLKWKIWDGKSMKKPVEYEVEVS